MGRIDLKDLIGLHEKNRFKRFDRITWEDVL